MTTHYTLQEERRKTAQRTPAEGPTTRQPVDKRRHWRAKRPVVLVAAAANVLVFWLATTKFGLPSYVAPVALLSCG